MSVDTKMTTKRPFFDLSVCTPAAGAEPPDGIKCNTCDCYGCKSSASCNATHAQTSQYVSDWFDGLRSQSWRWALANRVGMVSSKREDTLDAQEGSSRSLPEEQEVVCSIARAAQGPDPRRYMKRAKPAASQIHPQLIRAVLVCGPIPASGVSTAQNLLRAWELIVAWALVGPLLARDARGDILRMSRLCEAIVIRAGGPGVDAGPF
ncbi:hypothetical protein MPH_02712 [Macrophomina phaseolina MS6]|uniref:Uncharacterized protein n=1 Tax=Macrophomina phaseolina (strain MS6) TaxID=1126212 RepID=K2S4S0_MACPH|nr:hypothetical protein MPH_02712 [Macrophomina phaseolina MS6]